MSETHHAFLSLGSNIEPEQHLRQAIRLLQRDSQLCAISTAWENHAVGAPDTPNYLNACVELNTPLSADEILQRIIRPIEEELGRSRDQDKYAPRPIDIDLILFDDLPMRLEYWQQAFMVVPLAELIPQFLNPITGRPLAQSAQETLRKQWMLARPEVLQDLRDRKGS